MPWYRMQTVIEDFGIDTDGLVNVTSTTGPAITNLLWQVRFEMRVRCRRDLSVAVPSSWHGLVPSPVAVS